MVLGPLAHLVERLICNEEVTGSSPVGSTTSLAICELRENMFKIIEGFKQFILRGNSVDLAVGVVIGAAFNGVVQAIVKDLLTPLVGAVAHTPDFSAQQFTINGSKFMYGDFINNLISFLLVAVAVYFFVVLPMNTFTARFRKPEPVTTKQCPECLSEIPTGAKRCAHCAQPI